MKNMWEKHTIGKRILALCLLVTMLFDTVTASAVTFDEDSTQIDVVEETTELEEITEVEDTTEVMESTENIEKAGETIEIQETSELEEMIENSELIETEVNSTEENVSSTEDSLLTDASEAVTMGTFEDVEITFSGYSARPKGVFVPNTEEDYTIYLVSYNSADERLCSVEITLSSDIQYIYDIAKGTAYARLEAYSNESASETVAAYSEKIVRLEEPEIRLAVDEITVGAGTIAMSISYSGNMAVSGDNYDSALFRAELIYGTDEDESTWTNTEYHGYFDISERYKGNICFDTLEPEVTYYGKVRLYSEVYDEVTNEYISNYETTILLEPFETKSVVTYNLKTVFPDAVLRDWVMNRINGATGTELTEDSDVTNTQLESISGTLYLNRDNLETEAIRDITGIDLLTNLTDIYLNHNEIEVIDNVDWSKLSRLEEIYIRGNNITRFPDFSKNEKLTWINFDDNMLSEEEQKTVLDKLPANARYSIDLFSSQRSSLVELKMEENYYIYDSKVPFVAEVKGQKEYTAKLFIDGIERVTSPNWEDEILIEDSRLEAGEHTAKIELYNGEIKERETEEYVFQVVDENVFIEDMVYIYCEDAYIYQDIYFAKEISTITIVDSDGKVYAKSYNVPYPNPVMRDPRYKEELYLTEGYLYVGNTSIYAEYYNVLPVGTYHIKVDFADGTSEILYDKVQVVAKGQAFYKDAYITKQYEVSSEDYLYVTVNGYNLELDKFDYLVLQNGVELPVTYVSSKEESAGTYVVKLKKEGWQNYRNSSIELQIVPKDGYEVLGNFAPIYDWDSGDLAAYAVYNEVLGKMEIAVNKQYLNQTVSVVLREGWDAGQYPVVASGSASVAEGVTYITLHDADGLEFVPSVYGYCCEIVVGDSVYKDWIYPNIYVNTPEETYNYWDGTFNIVTDGRVDMYFYSDISYSEYGKDRTKFWVETPEDFMGSITLRTSKWGEDKTKIIITVSARRVPAGNYPLTLYKEDAVLGSTSLFVCNRNNYILDGVFAGWASESELKVQLAGVNLNKSTFTVTLYDADGNAVEGIRQKVTNRESKGTMTELTLTGLNRSDAYVKYYVKVSSNTMGEPYRRDGQLYYSDERGEYLTVYNFGDTAYKISEKRITGINVSKDIRNAVAQKPVTIRIYKPYDMEVVKEIMVNTPSALRYNRQNFNAQYCYFFNKNFWENLPERDITYDIVVMWDGKVIGNYSGVLGYEEWYYSVDREELYLDSKGAKTATLSVKNYAETPTIMSSDTSIAKLTISEDNPGEVTITALKVGTTEITITADGITKSFTLTVKNLPKVKAKSSVVLNSFFDTPKADLEITNSWDSEVTSVSISSDIEGLWLENTVDGKWYLCWDKSTTLAANTKVTLNFEVEGFEATEEDFIASQTITVNAKSTQPAVVLSTGTIEFKTYPYKEQYVDVTIKDNNSTNSFAVNPEDIALSKTPEGVDFEDAGVAVTYDETAKKLVVTASNEAVNGTYQFVIMPSVEMDAENVKRARPAILTVNLKGTEPVFKFNATNITLDAAYPGESEASIKLLMDEGYIMEEAVITAPNDSVMDFVAVETSEDGTITFRVIKAGLSKAGNYKVTVKVKAAWGKTFEMKETSIAVNVSNSSKASISSKSKSVTINPYIGGASVEAKLSIKGFEEQDSVVYTTSYEFLPTNELAKQAECIRFAVDEAGSIRIAGCDEGCEDGKYTYNLVAVITGTDGTVTCTKPLAFTVQLKSKVLTIVPAKSSVTVYKEYCFIEDGYYVVEIPVSIKETSEMKLDTALTNSMAGENVSARLSEDGRKVIVEFPTTLSKVSNLKITPFDNRFGEFKVSISVKSAVAKASFEAKTVTLNRYTDAYAVNKVADTEGYEIASLTNIVITNKKKEDVTAQFVTDSDRNSLTIGIAPGYEDTIVNGDYTVSVVPMVRISDAMDDKVLEACTFKLKLAQPKLKVSVGEAKKASQTVNLYPAVNELVSEAFELQVYSGDVKLEVSKVEIIPKDKKKVVATAVVGEDERVILSAVADETGEVQNGKNTFSAKVYVKNVNGNTDIEADTLTKAFVVNVRDLPKSITFAKTKLTYSPYIESKVTTTIKSAELEELLKTSDEYYYAISVEETNSKYKALEEDKKNDILIVTGNEDGVITVDNSGLPAKNTTYYYLVTVNLMQEGRIDAVTSYNVKFSVAVKNTLPKTILQANSINLDNAFVGQQVTNKVMLTTGTGLWTLDALSKADVIIKNGKKDVTGEGYFDINYNGTEFTISLKNKKEDGSLMTVPKGTYKVIITPHVSEKNVPVDDVMKAELKEVTLTVKVTSSRPTVKLASKVTVKVGEEEKVLKPSLKNNGTLSALTVVCSSFPKKATAEDVAGIEVKLLEDGTIGLKVEEGVLAGSYKFTLSPVTIIDGKEILLDAKMLTVTVKK